MVRISESELILPALMLLAYAEAGLTTTQLIAGLDELLHPSGPDLEILAGRSDTRFSQKVRNLTSHRTLTNQGLATRVSGETNAPYIIPTRGVRCMKLTLTRLQRSLTLPLLTLARV